MPLSRNSIGEILDGMIGIIKLSLCTVIILILGCAREPNPEEGAVRKCWDDYQHSLKVGDGVKAADLVDSSSIATYDRLLDCAIYCEYSDLEKYRIFERIIVAKTRYSLSLKEAQKMNGKGLFIYAVSNEKVDSNQIKGIRILKVVVEENKAYVLASVMRGSSPFKFKLVKENERWKINLNSTFELTDSLLKSSLKAEGKTEKEFIESQLSILLEGDIWPILWEPLINEKPE